MMTVDNSETHPLPPFAPQNARLLMLGSFPPPRERWKMDFYYPNIQNDMWRIFGLVFFDDREHFVSADGKGFREAAIRDFLTEKGIAISDTAHRIRRLQGNAADKSLQILEPLELTALLARLPQCQATLTTGGLATRTLLLDGQREWRTDRFSFTYTSSAQVYVNVSKQYSHDRRQLEIPRMARTGLERLYH